MTDKNEQPLTDVGVVLYTDGGCKPSRGIGGWGVHGYSYNLEPLNKANRKVNAITNLGYYDTNGATVRYKEDGTWSADKKGEVVTCHQPITYVDSFGSLIPESTNNIAELTAAQKALSIIAEIKPKQAHLLLDSEYVLKGITEWYPKWESMGWVKMDGTPTPNADLWKGLIAKHNDVKSYVDLSWAYVRGHSGDLGNDNADRLASRAIIAGRKGIEFEDTMLSSPVGYENKSSCHNRIFAYPRWYFVCNTHTDNTTSTGHYAYHIGTNTKEDEIDGKAANDTSFAVLYLKDREVVLDKVREYHNETTQHAYTNVVKVSLDAAFNPYNYDDILKNGCTYLERKGAAIYDCEDRVISVERSTPHLVFRTQGIFSSLEAVLEDFINGSHKLSTSMDITGELYEVVSTKKKELSQLRKDFKQSTKSKDVLVSCVLSGVEQQMKVKLTVGLDMPNRNTLVALAAKDPKVYLLTQTEGPNAFRVHVVIKTEDDFSIWSSVYSNLYVNLDL